VRLAIAQPFRATLSWRLLFQRTRHFATMPGNVNPAAQAERRVRFLQRQEAKRIRDELRKLTVIGRAFGLLPIV
jgi:hypothetical protein